MTFTGTHFWLRSEVKPNERRTPLMPADAKKLLEAGHKITVEESELRCVPISTYQALGCQVAPNGSWKSAPKDAVILGLKELPDEEDPLCHDHIFFGHCYDHQEGAEALLGRFATGQGRLFDLERLEDSKGRRVAAFGRSAGYIGMGVALLMWCHQQLHGTDLRPLTPYESGQNFVDEIKSLLRQTGRIPKVCVIGALGRCGRGAVEFAEAAGVAPAKWDMEETRPGGPFTQLLEYDVVINCIRLMHQIPPFLTEDVVLKHPERALSVLVDISCDYTKPENPLPIITKGTTFDEPSYSLDVPAGQSRFDIVGIDHLPSLIPSESSAEFSDQLFPHIVEFNKTPVWERALGYFTEHVKRIE